MCASCPAIFTAHSKYTRSSPGREPGEQEAGRDEQAGTVALARSALCSWPSEATSPRAVLSTVHWSQLALETGSLSQLQLFSHSHTHRHFHMYTHRLVHSAVCSASCQEKKKKKSPVVGCKCTLVVILGLHPSPLQPSSRCLSSILGKSNLQFAGMTISLTISTSSLNLLAADCKQVRSNWVILGAAGARFSDVASVVGRLVPASQRFGRESDSLLLVGILCCSSAHSTNPCSLHKLRKPNF